MAGEEVLLDLFDTNWFGHKIICNEKQTKDPQNKSQEYDDHGFLAQQNINFRSLSEQVLDSKIGSFFSSEENSLSPKLETIFSGKEVREDQSDNNPNEEAVKKKNKLKNKVSERKRRINKRSAKLGAYSKSLSELEFEELKGFMDLGFVFTEEECKDSKLVSMIPGLQRYSKKCNSDHQNQDQDYGDGEGCDDDHVVCEKSSVIARPYLSEVWDVLEQREKKEQIVKNLGIDWKVSSSLGNEIFMKDQLRFWAHSVASTVR